MRPKPLIRLRALPSHLTPPTPSLILLSRYAPPHLISPYPCPPLCLAAYSAALLPHSSSFPTPFYVRLLCSRMVVT